MNLGLGYESSDEETIAPVEQPQKPSTNDTPKSPVISSEPSPSASNPEPPQQPEHSPTTHPDPSSAEQGPLSGPALGPTASTTPTTSLPQQEDDAPPGSPYTATRGLIRTLTFPTVPNFNIPPSPPESPPQRSTKKFTQFLDLKKKGTHFNQRLEKSSVLKDPGHLQRLMKFAGLSERDQYVSTLPDGVAVPVTWPKEAHVEELRTSQKEILKKKDAERKAKGREGIEFVPAAVRSEASSRTGTPAAADKQALGKRKELEYRSGRQEEDSRTRRSRSRSPKRRRSRSRERR